MIRRPPRSTRKESSAASDVYKRQGVAPVGVRAPRAGRRRLFARAVHAVAALALLRRRRRGRGRRRRGVVDVGGGGVGVGVRRPTDDQTAGPPHAVVHRRRHVLAPATAAHLLTVVKVDRRIRWHYTTTILRLRIGARLTRYRNCKFHNFARTISRHADGIRRYSVPLSAGPLLPLPAQRRPTASAGYSQSPLYIRRVELGSHSRKADPR